MAGYSLIGAILLLGGIGYALDARLGTAPWLLLAGLLLGLIVGFYQLALTVWRMPESDREMRPARRLFAYSMLYLFLLFAILLVEHGFAGLPA